MIKIIKENKLISLFFFYFFISTLLYHFLNINILLPCIWKKIFNMECWFCGSTTACINVLDGEFLLAWENNKIIFFLPILLGVNYFLSRRR